MNLIADINGLSKTAFNLISSKDKFSLSFKELYQLNDDILNKLQESINNIKKDNTYDKKIYQDILNYSLQLCHINNVNLNHMYRLSIRDEEV